MKRLLIGTLVAIVTTADLSGQTRPRPRPRPRDAEVARRWCELVDAHAPGTMDGAALAIAGWSAEDLESVLAGFAGTRANWPAGRIPRARTARFSAARRCTLTGAAMIVRAGATTLVAVLLVPPALPGGQKFAARVEAVRVDALSRQTASRCAA